MSERWPVVRLGDLADVVTKGTTPTSVGHEFVDEGINFIKVESITPSGRFIKEKFAHITAACHEDLGRSQLQAGDILFSIAGALGRTGFVTGDVLPANTNQALAIIRLKQGIGVSQEFVLKSLETGIILEQIEKFKGGSAQQNLSLAQVRDFRIALPPLHEQQRIVALLDEAFAGLATAKANAERNLQNARAIFESYLQSVFTQCDWPIRRLGDLSEMVTKGTTPTSVGHSFVRQGINFVKIESITKTGRFIEEKFAQITAECHADLERSRLKVGDILFSIAGALGRTALVTDKILPANTNQALAIIRLKPDPSLLPKFVLKALETGVVLEQIEQFRGGAAQQNLSLTQVRDLHIVQPPLAEQQKIVANLDALSEETQHLTRLYERKLAALEELKKSLLHQAFNGEL